MLPSPVDGPGRRSEAEPSRAPQIKVFALVDGRGLQSTLWFDVEDLLQYGAVHRRPSGIQRLSFQIYQALQEIDGSFAIGFVRHAPNNQFRLVDWAEVVNLFDLVGESATIVDATTVRDESHGAESGAVGSGRPLSSPRRFIRLRKMSRRLPERFRYAALQFASLQTGALRALADTIMAVIGQVAARRPAAPRSVVILDGASSPGAEPAADVLLATVANRGDVLASIGSPWGDEDYAARLAHARSRLGLRTAVLVYDMIPVKRPEWCHRGIIRVFRTYYSNVLPIADTVFAISRSTADDLVDWCGRTGIALGGAPVVVPIGSGFGASTDHRVDRVMALGLPSRYVLFVATLEIRKNHALLFRVWRRLLETMERDLVPELVFVGAEGWLVRNFMQQLENSRFLDGKLRVIHNLGDDDLAAVYRGCMFTVFPSLYEGWGLPVTESLRFGKPCIAANVSSIPEAGGPLARYFDPGCLDEATRVIRAAIEDEAGLAAWTQQVRDEFRPVSWTETARCMEAVLRTGRVPRAGDGR